ncbi:MAG: TOBE domain-containing protein, partial [Pseudomonadota bacterium]
PAVFLFDEPLSNLDAKLRVQMRLEIKQLQARLGVTSLYVTHDQVEAMTMADRMIVLNEGRAEQIGSPLDVYQTPQSLFAAQFIGSPAMNIFDGTTTAGSVQLANGFSLPCHSTESRAVKVGIRPEHLALADNGPIALQVDYAEPLGATTLLHGTLANTSTGMIASLPGVHHQQQSISLTVDTDNIHLFDKDTGLRIN